MVVSTPSLGPLVYLVVEAVGIVALQCSVGFILAYAGQLTPELQKKLSEININALLPCLVFIKLASQLSVDKLASLRLIPIMFVAQTIISWGAAKVSARLHSIKTTRQSNFITAMSVFPNSNSLPVSLVMSLSKTVPSLLWLGEFPNDKASDVAARGLLYLVIFQQLGQTIRWTWGASVLLAPPKKGDKLSFREADVERAIAFRQDPVLYTDADSDDDDGTAGSDDSSPLLLRAEGPNYGSHLSVANSHANAPISSHPSSATLVPDGEAAQNVGPLKTQELSKVQLAFARISEFVATKFELLPRSVQGLIRPIWFVAARIGKVIWQNVNAPLVALICALIVASNPVLRDAFFTPGTFVSNTVTPAIKSLSAASVPLSLVVLGANIAKVSNKKSRIELPSEEDCNDGASTPELKARRDSKLVSASVLGRMFLPAIVSVPLLMFAAVQYPVSILRDPIFVVVCFLLVGAPPALQLAQICQKNDVYNDVMARVLIHGYVFWILPSTLVFVGLALMTVGWM